MSGLYGIRLAIKNLLLQDGLWADGEVLIKRRSQIWNDVAVATGASKSGQCIVVGVAKGVPDKGQSPHSAMLLMDLTIPLTLIELPSTAEEDDAATEDVRWEQTVMRLMGDPLGRSPLHYELAFDGFDEITDEQYTIRQTTFKTRLTLKK